MRVIFWFILNTVKRESLCEFVSAHSLLQLILCVCECTVGSSGTASLLTKVSAHAGLILAVGLRLRTDTMHISCKIKLMHHLFCSSKTHNPFIAFPR